MHLCQLYMYTACNWHLFIECNPAKCLCILHATVPIVYEYCTQLCQLFMYIACNFDSYFITYLLYPIPTKIYCAFIQHCYISYYYSCLIPYSELLDTTCNLHMNRYTLFSCLRLTVHVCLSLYYFVCPVNLPNFLLLSSLYITFAMWI